jgi:hypothetical protein
LGVVLGAAYMLLMVQKVFFGPVTRKENQGLSDLNLREIATALPLVVLALVMGLKPQPLLTVIEQSTRRYVPRAMLGPDSSEPQLQVVTRPPPTAPPEGPGALPTLKIGDAAPAPVNPAAPRERVLRPLAAPFVNRPMIMAAPPAAPAEGTR